MQCKLNCTFEFSKQKTYETQCALRQELPNSEDGCGPQEMIAIKKQLLVNMESKCGAPLEMQSNVSVACLGYFDINNAIGIALNQDQLWDCLLQTKYFDQTEQSNKSKYVLGKKYKLMT